MSTRFPAIRYWRSGSCIVSDLPGVKQTSRRWLAIAGLVVGVGCTAHNDPAPTPAITLAIAPASGSVVQGGSVQVTATVTGNAAFTGTASIAVEGLPNGVTGSVTGTQVIGSVTTATVNLSAAATATVGTSTLTVRGSSSGATDATASYALTVTAASIPNFSFTVGPAAGLAIAPGYTALGTIAIVRTLGFVGSVSFTLTGGPTGLTFSPAPVSTSGNGATFGLAASAGVTPGNYTLTFHGAASGLPEQTATLAVVIGAAGSGNVSLDFSACVATSKPIWLASQDGSGPWTRGTGTADVYRFNVSAATGQVAWVTQSGVNTYTVHQLVRTHDVLVAGTQVVCSVAGTKTINGTLANLGAGLSAKLYLGGSGVTRSVNGAFQIATVLDGSQDLVAYARSTPAPGTGDRALLRRAQNLVTGGSLATVDMTGGESFAPVAATMSATGALTGDTFAYSMEYFTGAGANGCQLAVLYGDNPAGATFTAYGFPAAQQVASDFHALAFSASEPGNSAVRTIIQYFHAMAATSVTLPAALPTPAFTSLGGPYRRLRAAFTMPVDYAGTAQLQYGDASGPSRFVIITADGGAFATQGGALALQDFTGVPGWDSSWGPVAATSSWSLTGISVPPVTACQEGAKYAFSQRFGSF